MKGLVGGADCRRNWTTALIPRSSGTGTHPFGAECAEAARIAWGGGRYKLARCVMRGSRAEPEQVSLRCRVSNCLANGSNIWTPSSPSQELARGGACSGALTFSGDLLEECRFLLTQHTADAG